jgi:hypothetical protein
MTRRLILGLSCFAISSLAFRSVAAQNYPTVPYKEAGDHVDQIVWVEGTVLKSENAAEGVYLLFSANEKYIRVLVPKANLNAFEGGVHHKYIGKKIKAVGKVAKYGHRLIVGVSEPKRIKIVEKDAT